MLKEDLKIKITELLASASFDEAGEWLNISIEPSEWPALAYKLRHTPGLDFDFLFCCRPFVMIIISEHQISDVNL